MPSWEETEHYEIVNEEVEDIPEITSTGKKAFLTLSFPWQEELETMHLTNNNLLSKKDIFVKVLLFFNDNCCVKNSGFKHCRH